MLKVLKSTAFMGIFSLSILFMNTGCTNTVSANSKKNPQTAENMLDNSKNPSYDSTSKLLFTEKFENAFPSSIPMALKYNEGVPDYLNYVFVKVVKAKLREKPTTNSSAIGEYSFYDRLELLGSVDQKGNIWHKVRGKDGKVGYLFSGVVEKRVFNPHKALEQITSTENFIKEAKENGEELALVNSYSPNPNNQNFKREKDKYGVSFDQNIEGVYKGETIYIPDRSIMKVLSKDKNRSRVKVLSIPDPYLEVKTSDFDISEKLSTQPITKAIAVDTKNQNMMIFEKLGGEWTIISYVYSKTGIESQLGFETPKGNFIAAVSKFEMLYNGEIGNKEGYAKYATRFSGGGYLHGTPLNYEEEINKEYFISLKEWTLGKFTGTRKCIRTEEDHARFLFYWILNNRVNHSDNNQVIRDNVLFVIF